MKEWNIWTKSHTGVRYSLNHLDYRNLGIVSWEIDNGRVSDWVTLAVL